MIPVKLMFRHLLHAGQAVGRVTAAGVVSESQLTFGFARGLKAKHAHQYD
jgi:hypothetical protein